MNKNIFKKEQHERPTSCKECGGKIKWSDIVLTSYPPIYSYYCEKCDKWERWRPYSLVRSAEK